MDAPLGCCHSKDYGVALEKLLQKGRIQAQFCAPPDLGSIHWRSSLAWNRERDTVIAADGGNGRSAGRSAGELIGAPLEEPLAPAREREDE
jgi:hypothetical protein